MSALLIAGAAVSGLVIGGISGYYLALYLIIRNNRRENVSAP